MNLCQSRIWRLRKTVKESDAKNWRTLCNLAVRLREGWIAQRIGGTKELADFKTRIERLEERAARDTGGRTRLVFLYLHDSEDWVCDPRRIPLET